MLFITNTGKPSKYHSITGGLASPPNTCFNSPIFPNTSASVLHRGNLSASQCVNPKDLHRSIKSFVDDIEPQERHDLTEHLVGIPSNSTSILAISEQADHVISVKLSNPALDSSEDDDHDEDVAFFGGSSEASSLPQDDDSTMVDVESRRPSPQLKGDDGIMAGVEYGEPPTNPPEDDAGVSMEPSQGDDCTMIDVESRQSSPNIMEDEASMVGIETREQLSDSNNKNEHGRAVNGADLSDSLGGKKLKPDSMVVDEAKEISSESAMVDEGGQLNNNVNVVETTPRNDIGSKGILLDLESPVATRRSSRNISAKNKPMIDYVPSRKSASGRKKPTFEKEETILEASIRKFPSHILINFYIGRL